MFSNWRKPCLRAAQGMHCACYQQLPWRLQISWPCLPFCRYCSGSPGTDPSPNCTGSVRQLEAALFRMIMVAPEESLHMHVHMPFSPHHAAPSCNLSWRTCLQTNQIEYIALYTGAGSAKINVPYNNQPGGVSNVVGG